MISRFFCPIPLAAGTCVALPEAAAHHAARVLRLAPGAAVALFNGDGTAWAGTLQSVRPTVTVQLVEQGPPEALARNPITLVQALASGDKMDWVVQKAVELGVSAIQPLATRRAVLKLSGARAEKRVAHWRSIAVSACEQSGRNRVPAIADIVSLEAWLADADGGWVLTPASGGALRERRPPDGALTLLVGPESGWDDEELVRMTQRGIEAVQLGPRVLRTETAGLAAIAAIQALWGDF